MTMRGVNIRTETIFHRTLHESTQCLNVALVIGHPGDDCKTSRRLILY